jgi:hypothetical protein
MVDLGLDLGRPLPDWQPDWEIMDVVCACWRRNCRHSRDLEAKRTEQRIRREQRTALTDDDVRWLRDHGWDG